MGRYLITLAFLALLPRSSFGQSYQVQDLGKLDATSAVGRGINSSGKVAGNIEYVFGFDVHQSHPFSFNNGMMTDIGTLSGGSGGVARDINEAGQIVGASDGLGFAEHAFVYSNGSMNDLGTLGGNQSNAWAISDGGQVVGYADLQSFGFLRHAFLYENGVMHDLGTLMGPTGRLSAAMDINSKGQIVGESYVPGVSQFNEDARAFLYDGGSMKDLGTLGGRYSNAEAINDGGAIVGESATVTTGNGLIHAFRYLNGTMFDLGTLGGDNSQANDINSAGIIVGESNLVVAGTFHGFVVVGGVMYDLNSLIDHATGWTIATANAINAAGQITGSGIINGEQHAYILTPVPEPNSVILMAFAIAAICAKKQRQIITSLPRDALVEV